MATTSPIFQSQPDIERITVYRDLEEYRFRLTHSQRAAAERQIDELTLALIRRGCLRVEVSMEYVARDMRWRIRVSADVPAGMEVIDVIAIPITNPAQLSELDPDEVMEGYRDGCNGEPEPGNNRSTAYWHGWRNGAVDGGHRERDDAQALLARRAIKSEFFTRQSSAG